MNKHQEVLMATSMDSACFYVQSVHYYRMSATLTDLHRATRKVVRRVLAGESVPVTEHGQTIFRLVPDSDRVRVSADKLREAEITDAAILHAIEEARR